MSPAFSQCFPSVPRSGCHLTTAPHCISLYRPGGKRARSFGREYRELSSKLTLPEKKSGLVEPIGARSHAATHPGGRQLLDKLQQLLNSFLLLLPPCVHTKLCVFVASTEFVENKFSDGVESVTLSPEVPTRQPDPPTPGNAPHPTPLTSAHSTPLNSPSLCRPGKGPHTNKLVLRSYETCPPLRIPPFPAV